MFFGMLSASAESVTLFSFDNARNIRQWHVRKGAAFSHASWPDGHPGSCGRVTYYKYRAGQDRWPAIVLRNFKPSDWRSVEFIRMDIYAVKPGMLTMELRNKSGEKVGFRLSLEPGRNQICQRLYNLDLKEVCQLHLFLHEPASEQIYHVGDIQLLMRDLPGEFASLRKRLDVYRKWDFRGVPEAEKCLRQALKRESALRNHLGLNANTAELLEGLESDLQRLAYLKQEQSIAELTGNALLTVLWASPMEKVHRENQLFLQLPQKQAVLSAARGETESAQLIIRSGKTLKNLSVKLVSPLKNGNFVIPAADCSLAPVGYVYCKEPPYNVSRTGYWPDPLLAYADKLDLEAGKWQAWWLDVAVPQNQEPGVYQGVLAVSADGMEEMRAPFRVKVRRFSLPEGVPYPIAASLRDTHLGNFHPKTPEERQRWHELCADMMFRHRINPDSIYHMRPASPADAKRRIDRGGRTFTVRYIGPGQILREREFKEFDEAVRQYRELGIMENAILYCYDERPVSLFPEMVRELKKIRARYPDLKIATTAYDFTFGAESILGPYIDIWIPVTQNYGNLLSHISKARSRGCQVWWYICLSPRKPYANWLIEYPSLDGRLLMGAMSWKYQPDGFLYYRVAGWREYWQDKQGKWHSKPRPEPMKGAPLTNWTGASFQNYNGDGNLIYPGEREPLPSIRLKNIRDGLEDYLYFRLLSEAGKDASFMSAQWRKAAEKELQVEPALVKSLTEFASDPAVLLKKRERIAALLDAYSVEKANRLK